MIKKETLLFRPMKMLLNFCCIMQVYEQLSPLGLCLSHHNTLRLCDLLVGDQNRQLIEAITARKRLRLVGDNVNFTTRVRDERLNKHGKMYHFFGSAVLVHDSSFPRLSTIYPQMNICDMKADMFIANVQEQEALIDD
jgi:hypothetical protein